jgi:hypothetical protein
MLLKRFNKFIFDTVTAENNFIVLNINNSAFFDFFSKRYTIFHYKDFIGFGNILNLFSGNNYFVFINKYIFFYDLLDLFINDDNEFELLAACSNNYFTNIVNKFFNMSSNLFFVVLFFCFFFIYFLDFIFSKLMTVYIRKINFFE